MAFDGVVLRAVTEELRKTLLGGRIERIHQPTARDLDMAVRQRGNVYRLFLSAHPRFPRIHLARDERMPSGTAPPAFCMALRKHCEGGRIRAIQQVEMERILWLDVERRDELGDHSIRRLIVEIMGRHSNILLIDPESRTIIESIVHVTHAVSRHREVLPGRTYVAPPAQNKRNPLTVEKEEFRNLLRESPDVPLATFLVDTFQGFSPLLGQEMEYRAAQSAALEDAAWSAFRQIIDPLQDGFAEPVLYLDPEGRPQAFHAVPLLHLQREGIRYESVSRCVEDFYRERAVRDARRQQAMVLIQRLTSEIEKNRAKMEKLQASLREAEDAERFRIWGELLTAYAHMVPPGARSVTLANFYDEMKETTIALDPSRSATENAQSYFRKYRKRKNSIPWTQQQIEAAREEIAYLEGILVQLEDAGPVELEEIREELAAGHYIRAESGKPAARKKKADTISLRKFVSSEGTEILVGKNNKQNDYLTMRLARADDVWLHVKDMPGSHVVIREASPSETTLREAAVIAAFYSKGRDSSQVPVDYTKVKHVWKPRGAKPGFVLYDHQRTLYVTPDRQEVERLHRT